MAVYNAILLQVDDMFRRVYIDFEDPEAVAEAIHSEGVRILHTQGTLDAGEAVGQHICAYYDRYEDDDTENDLAQELTGYDYVPGEAVVCGCGDDYGFQPLRPDALERLCEMFEEWGYFEDSEEEEEPEEEPEEDDDVFDDGSSNIFSEGSRPIYGGGSSNISNDNGHSSGSGSSNISNDRGRSTSSGSSNIFSEGSGGYEAPIYHSPVPKPQADTYYLELIIANNANKLSVIRAVQEINGMDLMSAKRLVESAPAVIARGLTKQQADAGFDALAQLGCNVKQQRE